MSAEPSATDAASTERKALRFSTFGYLGMAALGIGFAIATRSEAILLDGVYSLVSVGATLAAMRVATLVHNPGTTSFQFGFAHLEPLVNAMRGFLTHVVLPEDWQPPTAGGLDDVRCRVARSLEDVPLRLVTDTVFTADERWSLVGDHRDCRGPG